MKPIAAIRKLEEPCNDVCFYWQLSSDIDAILEAGTNDPNRVLYVTSMQELLDVLNKRRPAPCSCLSWIVESKEQIVEHKIPIPTKNLMLLDHIECLRAGYPQPIWWLHNILSSYQENAIGEKNSQGTTSSITAIDEEIVYRYETRLLEINPSLAQSIIGKSIQKKKRYLKQQEKERDENNPISVSLDVLCSLFRFVAKSLIPTKMEKYIQTIQVSPKTKTIAGATKALLYVADLAKIEKTEERYRTYIFLSPYNSFNTERLCTTLWRTKARGFTKELQEKLRAWLTEEYEVHLIRTNQTTELKEFRKKCLAVKEHNCKTKEEKTSKKKSYKRIGCICHPNHGSDTSAATY